ncbi:MAG TPA: S8/S53 family peptidase [Mycobacteriales bacterium]|nr:S8/S53 family peptidase [Mycobacteriales bacterium]
MLQRTALRFRLANHVHGLPFDPPRWGEAPRLRAKDTMPQGRGTAVAVLDSGVSWHPWLEGSYGEPVPDDAVERWDLSGPALPRHVGHGTFVAGVVLQYAPAATLIPRRVIDINGDADDWRLAAVINDLVDADPDVVNLSLGPTPNDQQGEVDEGTRLTVDALRRLQDTCGTVVVVAGGNTEEQFPSEHIAPDDELTVVVGALDLSRQPAWFSNAQPVRIWAPGVDVLSSFVHFEGPVSLNHPEEDDHRGRRHHGHAAEPGERPVAPFTGWARWNGTSFAAPAVAGAVAAEISSLSGIEDRAERRRRALLRVLDMAEPFETGEVKGKALAASPVALQGPPRS